MSLKINKLKIVNESFLYKEIECQKSKVDVPFKNDMTCILKFAIMYGCLLK